MALTAWALPSGGFSECANDKRIWTRTGPMTQHTHPWSPSWGLRGLRLWLTELRRAFGSHSRRVTIRIPKGTPEGTGGDTGLELARGEVQEEPLLSHSGGSPMSQHWQGPQELGAGASSSHAQRNQAAGAAGEALPSRARLRGDSPSTDHWAGLQKSSLLA